MILSPIRLIKKGQSIRAAILDDVERVWTVHASGESSQAGRWDLKVGRGADMATMELSAEYLVEVVLWT